MLILLAGRRETLMSGLRSGMPHRGREVYYQVTDPAYAGVGGATLETRRLQRMRVSVPASKLIFETTPSTPLHKAHQ